MIGQKIGVSGYRGIWGESLTAEIAVGFAKAFAQFVKEDSKKENPTVLIGRDGRESGPTIRDAIIPVLKELGVNIIDGDILPTPTVLFAVRKHGYDGGIIITASHNPIEYNGLKFVNKTGFFTTPEETERINEISEGGNITLRGLASATGASTEEIFHQKNLRASESNISSEVIPNFIKEHADFIIENIDAEAIRAKKFKIAVDMCNGAASVMDPYLFEQLGCELVPMNNIANGKFTHKPEPLKQNLGGIEKLVKDSSADLGFAQDPDADRLVVIDENGEMVSEEYTVSFGVEAVLSKTPGTVVINMTTSQMNVDIAAKYGVECIRTKVGEPNVVAGMKENNAVVGGEGGGGVLYPAINFARDSFVSLSLILELLAKRNQTVSECVGSFPKYIMMKDKVPQNIPLPEMFAKIKSHFTDAQVNELDGVTLTFSDKSWINLRASNTEPIVRLYGEATTKERIEQLFTEVKSLLS